jgi:hypothetical protein
MCIVCIVQKIGPTKPSRLSQVPLAPRVLLVFSALTNNIVVKIMSFQFRGGLTSNLAHNDLS